MSVLMGLPAWRTCSDEEEVFEGITSTCRGIKSWQTDYEFPQLELASSCTAISKWGGGVEIPALFCNPEPRRRQQPLRLTDAANGLLRQKTEQNLTEIAKHLLNNHAFAEVDGQLALFRSPCWQLLSPRQVPRVLSALLAHEDIVSFLSPFQLTEIAARILNASETLHLNQLPTIDPHILCCRDRLFCWPENTTFPPRSQDLRFGHLEVYSTAIAPCHTPYFDTFLAHTTQGEEALRQLILEVIGVIITGYPCKNFFVFEGTPDSGKSQLGRFLKGVLGDTSCFAVNEIGHLGDRWTTGMLPGKLLCVCSDVPDKPLQSKTVATIKQLTGDDPIRGEQKYQSPFVFQNTAKLLFLSNFPLRTSGVTTDSGFMRRQVRVPFCYCVPLEMQIPHLYNHLLEEAGGIIWLSLQALEAFEARNARFTSIEDTKAASHMLPKETAEARFLAFVSERCRLNPDASISAADFFAAYHSFEAQHYPSAKPISHTYFGKLVKAWLNSDEDLWRTSKTRGYSGIELRSNLENIL